MLEGFKKCPDCQTEPGCVHKVLCDIERCSVCGGQYISCGCKGHDKIFSRWSGLLPGEAECKFFNIDINEFYIKKYHRIFFIKPKGSDL